MRVDDHSEAVHRIGTLELLITDAEFEDLEVIQPVISFGDTEGVKGIAARFIAVNHAAGMLLGVVKALEADVSTDFNDN